MLGASDSHARAHNRVVAFRPRPPFPSPHGKEDAMHRLRLSPASLALLLTVLAMKSAPAQTADAGTPVVSVHTTDEIYPVLVRDGANGAFVGFQTIVPGNVNLGIGSHGIIHIARLQPD